MVDRALGLDQTYYETECPDITSRLTVDAQTVQSGTAEKVGVFLQSLSYFLVAFIVGFSLNAQLTAILFAAVIPSMALLIWTGTSLLVFFSKKAADSTTAAAVIAEGAIKAVQVVQAFDAFEPLTKEHRSNSKFSANALAFWQGSRIIRNSAFTGSAGTVYAIVFLILDASFVIGQAGPFIQSFAQAAAAGHRILSLINYPKIPIDVYSTEGIPVNSSTFGKDKSIDLKNVSFAYPARPLEPVLDNVNITIKTGTSVGIVGASGSGKSTIAALLLRLYDPSQGHIIIDNHMIPEYHLSSLRKEIALVDQDPAIFSGTVYMNIRDGVKGSPLEEKEMRERCTQAAKAADAWDFIESLPYGLDTWLGEPSGTKLSGGQKQRLCLARALVGDPSLLILDEATSALDTISEAAILSSLARSRSTGHRTTVVIAHRLASVKTADNIFVMGQGRVLEQGSHELLMKKEDGAYRQLINVQQFSSEGFCKSVTLEDTDIIGTKDSLALEEAVLDIDAPYSALPKTSKTVAYSTLSILQRCFALSQAKLTCTLLAFLGSSITGSLIIGESIIFGHLVQLLNGSVNSEDVDFYCLMFFIVALAALAAYTTSGSFFGIASEHLIFRVRDISLQTILRQDMEWFLKPGRSTSSLASVISMDSGNLSSLSGVIIGTVISALVSVVGGAILAHVVAWKIAIVLFATAPIVILSGFLRLRVLSKVEEKNQRAYTEAASLATEACSSIRTIAALGTEKATLTRFQLTVGKYREQTFRDTVLGNLLLAFALAITYFVYALAYWWGSKQVRSGTYTSLQFFTVLPAILFSAQAAGQILSVAPDIGRAKGAASRVFALHDQIPTIDKTGTQLTIPQTRVRSTTPSGSITFKNVSLTYESRPNAPIFTNLNLEIKAGETVALVGRSGAGKTSSISLIERFYDPTSGAILLDGVDIRSVPVSQHRARLSLVSQDPDLFAGSVAFNVGLGVRPGHVATREEIEEACKAVGIHEFVSGLPDGQCGVNGSQLSGGQKQRVAIARAYIRDPEILLLDEATSALDSYSEAKIQEAITAVSRKRTTIMIAHRLTSVQRADRILVFDQGTIIEEGRHEELMRSGGIYEQMLINHSHKLGIGD
ncbi:hypothetical protein B7494_g91 [Chlorociboria aeruginascens]|nr:hypothetical protein B7494_g91 [Chlorociboria aeruginascens]